MASSDHYHSRALSLRRGGSAAAAEAACRAALALAPQDVEAGHLLGLMHCKAGRSTDGLRYLARTLWHWADHAKYHVNFGGALFNLQKTGAAISERASESLSSRPDAPPRQQGCSRLNITLLVGERR